jgi:hypothetical protein
MLTDAEPTVDTAPLDDPEYVAPGWQDSTRDGQRDLLRLAWTTILIART